MRRFLVLVVVLLVAIPTGAAQAPDGISSDANHKGALEYLGELYGETNRSDKARALLARLERLCPLGCDELADLRAVLAR